MNRQSQARQSSGSSGGRKILLVAAFGGLAWLSVRALGDPDLRAGIAWAIQSMIVPPDQAAGWQQRVGRAPRWRRRVAESSPTTRQRQSNQRTAHATVGV